MKKMNKIIMVVAVFLGLVVPMVIMPADQVPLSTPRHEEQEEISAAVAQSQGQEQQDDECMLCSENFTVNNQCTIKRCIDRNNNAIAHKVCASCVKGAFTHGNLRVESQASRDILGCQYCRTPFDHENVAAIVAQVKKQVPLSRLLLQKCHDKDGAIKTGPLSRLKKSLEKQHQKNRLQNQAEVNDQLARDIQDQDNNRDDNHRDNDNAFVGHNAVLDDNMAILDDALGRLKNAARNNGQYIDVDMAITRNNVCLFWQRETVGSEQALHPEINRMIRDGMQSLVRIAEGRPLRILAVGIGENRGEKVIYSINTIDDNDNTYTLKITCEVKRLSRCRSLINSFVNVVKDCCERFNDPYSG